MNQNIKINGEPITYTNHTDAYCKMLNKEMYELENEQLKAENIKLKKDIALLEELDGAYHNALAIECLKEVRKYIYKDYKNCKELLKGCKQLSKKKSLTEYGEGCLDVDEMYIDFIDNKIKELEEE